MQKTAYELRMSGLSSGVCPSDLLRVAVLRKREVRACGVRQLVDPISSISLCDQPPAERFARHCLCFRRHHRILLPDSGSACHILFRRSEEHTSELQSLMRISYAVFCLKKKTKIQYHIFNISRRTTTEHTNILSTLL